MMFIVVFRTVILYALVITAMRLMGKRQIGQLQPYELAVAVMVSALAAVSMEDMSLPLINTIIPILLILAMQIIVSYLCLKYGMARALLCGKPSIVVHNGKIQEVELRNLRVNMNDLLEQLRLNGYPNIADVEFAVLETNGQLSVIPKSQKRPVTPGDLNVDTAYEGLSASLIIDGEIEYSNLDTVGLTADWLRAELAKFGIRDLRNILHASLDTAGNLYFQEKKKSVGDRR